jgi:hypothetical protein
MPTEVIDAAENTEDPNAGNVADESAVDASADAAQDGQVADDGVDVAEPDALIVTIGDEQPAEEDERTAPSWVKELRKSDREKTRRIRELESRLHQAVPAQQAVVAGPRPTLKDFDYDEDKFSAELDAWHSRKSAADEQVREAQRAQQAQAEDWQKRVNNYRAQAAALKVPNFEAAEEVVRDTLSITQQGLIVRACKQPALMVAALGNNTRRARELAEITDPVEFVAELIRTETQLKTQARKPATAPEKQMPRSSMSGAAAVDNQLAKLQEQASKTGDRTQVVRYLQGKRSA